MGIFPVNQDFNFSFGVGIRGLKQPSNVFQAANMGIFHGKEHPQ
jgi:hypothetical protein